MSGSHLEDPELTVQTTTTTVQMSCVFPGIRSISTLSIAEAEYRSQNVIFSLYKAKITSAYSRVTQLICKPTEQQSFYKKSISYQSGPFPCACIDIKGGLHPCPFLPQVLFLAKCRAPAPQVVSARLQKKLAFSSISKYFNYTFGIKGNCLKQLSH